MTGAAETGVHVKTAGLLPPLIGTRVAFAGSIPPVTDGPLAGAYAVVFDPNR